MGISDRKRSIDFPVNINLDLNQETKPNQFLVDNNFKGGDFVGRKKSGNVFAGSKLYVDNQGIYNEKNITPDLFKKFPKQTPVSEGNRLTPTPTPSITPTISLTPSNTVTPSITPTNTITPTQTYTPTPTPTPQYKFLPNGGYLLDTIDNDTSAYFYGYFTGYSQNNTSSKHIIKLNQDLTIDYSFSVGTGFNNVQFGGESILQQPDGKIIATGTFTSYSGVSKNRIVRLNVDGSIDNTFVVGTGFNDFTLRHGIDSLGNIYIPGRFTTYKGVTTSMNLLIKLNSGGTMDTTFSASTGFVGGGNVTTGVLMNPDDTMYVTGYFNTFSGVSANRIIKLFSNGRIDNSFNYGTGFNNATNNPIYLLRISGETSFYALSFNGSSGGFSLYNGTPVSQMIKLNSDGTIDSSFNKGTGFTGGTGTTANSLVATSRIIWINKILVVGNFASYNGVPSINNIILNSDGSVFQSFTTNYEIVFTIGNKLYASEPNDYLKLIMTYP